MASRRLRWAEIVWAGSPSVLNDIIMRYCLQELINTRPAAAPRRAGVSQCFSVGYTHWSCESGQGFAMLLSNIGFLLCSLVYAKGVSCVGFCSLSGNISGNV